MKDDCIEIGDVVAGKYRVERLVGQGTMGTVVAATQLNLDRAVALKLMSGGASHELGARFLREARVASMLKSPHAGKVLDVGELPGGAPYIVMELLEGQDLAAVLKDRGPLPTEAALTFVLHACEAIAEAHFMGIVHRDLKPANLFLTTGPGGSPCVKVLDFGVSKLGACDLDLTKTGQMLGSPLYMAPEQLNSSKDADARSDIWALGVILYELLAGATPYHGATVLELCRSLVTEPPTPLDQHRPDVPAGLCAVIMQCLEKDRERRWPNVAAFAAALAPFVQGSAAAYVERIARAQQEDVTAQTTTTALLRPPFVTRMRVSSFDAPDVASTAFPLVATSAPAGAAAASVRRRSRHASVGLSAVLLAGTALTLLLGFHGKRRHIEGRSLSSSAALLVPAVPAAPAPASAVVEPSISAVAEQVPAPAPAVASASAPPVLARPRPPAPSKRPRWDDYTRR
jgi:eukaryotic-like serine/threonine-protein kinase